ncbi:Protein phosphatase PTC7 [Podila clonocystis]|nr:Protein phosphatase PTC7 [Podila clonocystis]
MLGRNAARPFGMTPTRLMAVYSTAASQRITHWITKPFALVHMQRYISVAPQLLLTSSNNSSSHSSAARALSATHIEPLHTASVLQQQQQQHQTQPSLHDHEASQKPLPESINAFSPSPNSTATATSPSGVSFNYLLAASWHPKSRQRKSHAMTTNASSTDEESKTKWWKQKQRIGKVDAGEDAFFHVSTPSRVALGVADGVGGWSEVGVDPALFSWALMDNAEAVARQTDVNNGSENKEIENNVLDAQTILDGAYSELVKGGKVEAGSSTACILSLCKLTGTLRASNLGDSAYLLIRDNRCIYESPSQQHFWNCPYQLTVLPPGYPGAGAHVMDMPKDAAQTTHQLQDGDVIVLATDGFWDNVFTKEAIELVDRELGDVIKSKDTSSSVEDVVGRVRALSQRLTNTARRFSLDQKRLTPFSQGARHIRAGGKIDDITVIVTLVRAMAQQDPSAEEQA